MTRLPRHTSLARVILILGFELSLLAWVFDCRLVGRQARTDLDIKEQATIIMIERRTRRYVDRLHGLNVHEGNPSG